MARVGAWIVVLAIVGGCAAQDGRPVSPSASPPDAASATSSSGPADIVGVWQGEHECLGIVDALQSAGFSEAVVIETLVGNGLLSRVDSGADMSEIAEACAEAVSLPHAHEFTADGQFFSYNDQGEQVDFGTYEVVDDDTLVIGAPDREDVTFDFSISGDQLTLEPQLDPGCLQFECQWAVMVAMPWTQMERVDVP